MVKKIKPHKACKIHIRKKLSALASLLRQPVNRQAGSLLLVCDKKTEINYFCFFQ